uniref:Uncharacterized protein n=1 Tax=Acrobeloides nanus TaxID=290746 RepID=A0A914DTW6_9BILA
MEALKWIFPIFLIILVVDGRTQCYKASGQVFCPTDHYKHYGVKVRLMDKDPLPWEADDEMGTAYTDEDGNYTVTGCGDDFGFWWNDPDPYIYIDHRCPEPGRSVSIAHRYKTIPIPEPKLVPEEIRVETVRLDISD